MDHVIDRFRRADTAERLELVSDEALADELRAALGEKAFGELRKLAATRRPRAGQHLGAATTKNVVFVPGVMGSMLTNTTKGGVWWIDARTARRLAALRLSPDGLVDHDPDDRIQPFTVDYSYAPFLTAALRRDDLGVEQFPYDWRKPLAHSAQRLRDLIVATHAGNGRRPVHLVAHSMGGLMVRTTLARHGAELWPLLGRIVFAGTPHFGSPAIAGYLKNHLWGFDLIAVLGAYLPREALRSMWGVLGMLPAPAGIYPGTRQTPDPEAHPCLNFDPYLAHNWKLDLTAAEESRLQAVLDGAATAHRELWAAHRALTQDQRDRMLVIAGVGHRTLFRLAYEPTFLGRWERAAKVTDRVPGDPNRDGDGRVPLASTTLDWVPARFVRGVHGGLLNIPAVAEDVFAFLTGGTLRLPGTAKGALAGHLGAGDASPAPTLDGTAQADGPGLRSSDGIDPDRLTALMAAAEQGRLPDLEQVRLL